MEKVTSFYGYDIFALTREEARRNGRIYPCLCAFYNDHDEDEDGAREVNTSKCEFEGIEEALEWCREYSRD